ncbi:mediator complex subunit 8 [Brevipalpus obovatus]|uniref:mediator complex subunit 8 n=1 Tax=Brevipalpus obovatus TaxID=246614 RepID=UPI003D9DF3E1
MEREEKILDVALDALISRCQDLKNSLTSFLARLENDYNNLDWPGFLDNFALLSGQINNMMKVLKNDKTPQLRNRVLLPLKLSPDRDEELAKLTEGRVSFFNHEMVPDYLRTKLEPDIESRENLILTKANSINPDTAQKQITSVNKIANHIIESVKNAKEEWESESNQRLTLQPTFSVQDTNTMIAAISLGKDLKPPSMIPQKPPVAAQPAMGAGPSSGPGPRPGGKAPTIKTNIKSASSVNPYSRS